MRVTAEALDKRAAGKRRTMKNEPENDISRQIGALINQQQRHHDEDESSGKCNRNLTFLAVMLSSAAAAATIYQAIYAQQQFAEMRSQDRAWLEVVGPTFVGPVHFDQTGMHLSVRIGFRVSGKVPATRIWVYGQIFPFDPKIKFIDLERRVCAARSRPPGFETGQGFSLFEDQPPIWEQIYPNIKAADLQKEATLVIQEKQVGEIVTYLIGCIEYRYPGSRAFHHTPYIYELDRTDFMRSLGWRHMRPAEGDIPPDQIEYLNNPVASGDID